MKSVNRIIFALIFCGSLTAYAGESQVGRYQIVINPSARADTYLLDTWTGKVWRQTQFSDMDGEPLVWIFMDRIDSEKDGYAWFRSHLSKEEAAAKNKFNQPPTNSTDSKVAPSDQVQETDEERKARLQKYIDLMNK